MDYKVAKTPADLHNILYDTAERCVLELVSEGGCPEHIDRVFLDGLKDVVLFDRVRQKGIHIYLEWYDNYAQLYEERFTGDDTDGGY